MRSALVRRRPGRRLPPPRPRSAGAASADPTWAPAATATIHPGVMMFTDGAQCTANFVYTDGASVYLGYAAHCAGTGAATETDGCLAGTLPARHAGRDRRRLPARHPRLQLVAHDAGDRRDRPRRLRLQRLRPRAHRPGRRRQRQPVDPALGRPDRPRHDRRLAAASGSTPTATRACALGITPAVAQDRRQPRHRRAAAGATRATRSPPASPATPAARCSTPRAGPPACCRRWRSAPSRRRNNFGDLSHELAYSAQPRRAGGRRRERHRGVQRRPPCRSGSERSLELGVATTVIGS